MVSLARSETVAVERLRALPRASIGCWPTPVLETPLSGRPAILIKRDDLSAFGRGGAKARKIAYLLGYMQARGHTDLVTVAGNVTNLAFDLALAFEQSSLGLHLHIIDDPPATPQDRKRIFAALEGRVTLLGPSRRHAFVTTISKVIELRAAGRKPLWVLPGLSHPAGILGSACGFLEMADQLAQARRPLPRTVFVTAATGTTLAGFLLAEQALRAHGHAPIRVIGAQIYPGRIESTTRWLGRWAGLSARMRSTFGSAVQVSPAALHGGFGHFTPRLEALCARVREQAQIAIDPIFGGKTWSVMEDYLDREKPKDGEVLYWHCGYTPEWRALGQAVQTRRGAE